MQSFFYFMTKLNRHVSLLATTFILNKNNKQKDLKKPQIFINGIIFVNKLMKPFIIKKL